MQLNFMGIGSAFNPAMGNNGAYFAKGEDLYLIDCGEQAFRTLFDAAFFDRYPGALTVLLTHTHADHCGSLGTLALYAAERLGRPLTLVHPHPQARGLMEIMGVRDSQYRLLPALDEKGITATPVPVRHLAMNAYAYLIGDGDETICYSGDAADIPAGALEGLREGRIARLYQDTSFFDGPAPENPAHLPFSTLLSLAEPSLRDRVVVMHFNRDFRAEAVAQGFAVANINLP